MSLISHVSGLVCPIVLKSPHIAMKGGIRNTLQVSLKEDGMYIIDGLSLCFELCIVMIEVSVKLLMLYIIAYGMS